MSKAQKGKGALEIIEEAIHILRSNPLSLLPFYFIGSLPFVMAFLYFWADMSRSAFAPEYCLTASLGLAALFIWMKCWQAVFCRKVRDHVNHQPSPPWTFKQTLRLLSSQAILSGTGVVLLPIALAIAVPFGWVYAFYQNLSSEDNGSDPSVKDLYTRSWRLAHLWPGQNHAILIIISGFSLFVFLNLGLTIYVFPIFLKKFLGIEMPMAMTGHSIFNATFLSAVCGLTYLCVDPLIKIIYTLRCFYGASLKTGEDLITDLSGSAGFRRGLSYVFILLFVSAALMHGSAYTASGQETSQTTEKRYSVTPDELDDSIEKVMGQREFVWRMPEENMKKIQKEESGLLGRFVTWAMDNLRALKNFINNWWTRIRNWFKGLFPDIKPDQINARGWLDAAHVLLYSILVVLICLLAIILWRLIRGRRKSPARVAEKIVLSKPDLSDDYVNPVELPADHWLGMAKDLMQKQSLRLALRAFYLSTLARLAERDMITVAKFKSNMDYVRELQRRAHEHQELLSLFSANVQTFDRSWYGMHEVTKSVLDLFISNQERMAAIVHG
jgi:hypothetical protein